MRLWIGYASYILFIFLLYMLIYVVLTASNNEMDSSCYAGKASNTKMALAAVAPVLAGLLDLAQCCRGRAAVIVN